MESSVPSRPASQSAALQNPSWLQDGSVADSSGGAATTAVAPEEAEPGMKRMMMLTRLINLGLSVVMIVVSLLSLLTTQSATTGVLALYLVLFSCLLCCFETHLKQVSKIIAMNFGFMYSAKARIIFMLFVGRSPCYGFL